MIRPMLLPQKAKSAAVHQRQQDLADLREATRALRRFGNHGDMAAAVIAIWSLAGPARKREIPEWQS